MSVDKIIDTNLAAKAYSNSLNVGKVGASGGDIVSEDEGLNFSDLLGESLKNTVETMREGEKMSAQAVTGKADIVDVVQAVSQAELALQTVVSVRDRLISAYQDIMRMPI